MVKSMEQREICNLFAKVAEKKGDGEKDYHERVLIGAETFIRSTLGFLPSKLGMIKGTFGSLKPTRIIKTLEDMAQIFYEIGMVSSVYDGKRITQKLDGKGINITRQGMVYEEYLEFRKIPGKLSYCIEINRFSC